MVGERENQYEGKLKFCNEKYVIEICKEEDVKKILTKFADTNSCEIMFSLQLHSKHESSTQEKFDAFDSTVDNQSLESTTVKCDTQLPTISTTTPVLIVNSKSPVVSTVSTKSKSLDLSNKSSVSSVSTESLLSTVSSESPVLTVKHKYPVSTVSSDSSASDVSTESSAIKIQSTKTIVKSESPEFTSKGRSKVPTFVDFCTYRAYFSTANFSIYDIGQWIEENYGEIWEIFKRTTNHYTVDFKFNESLDKFIQCRENITFKGCRIVMEKSEIKLEKRYKLAATVLHLNESIKDQDLIKYCEEEGYDTTTITRDDENGTLVHFINEEMKIKFCQFVNHMICGKKVEVEPYGEWQSFKWRKKNRVFPEVKSANKEFAEEIGKIEDLSSQDLIDVRALQVLSPSEIWCCKASSDATRIMNEIDKDCQKFGYHESKNVSDDQMTPGSFYLARVKRERDRWYRVKLLIVCENNQMKVFCIDTGYTGSVKRDKLRTMPDELKIHPGQAFRIKLAGIRPAATASGQIWTQFALETFRQFKIKDIDIQLKAILSKRMEEDYSYEGSLYTYESRIEDATTLNEQVIVEDLKEQVIRKGLALRIET